MKICSYCHLPITDDATIKAQRTTCVCMKAPLDNVMRPTPVPDLNLADYCNNETNIRAWGEKFPVCIEELDKSSHVPDDCIGRLIVVAKNEGGFNSTSVDLLDIIEWTKKNKPQLIGISITAQHARSLSELMKHYRKMKELFSRDCVAENIAKDNPDSTPLTLDYLDELIKDLEK